MARMAPEQADQNKQTALTWRNERVELVGLHLLHRQLQPDVVGQVLHPLGQLARGQFGVGGCPGGHPTFRLLILNQVLKKLMPMQDAGLDVDLTHHQG
eukprot:COSAG02_NODE_1564_length_11912_cov_7.524676_7_plen_98_part_00